jgi:hypothetical protein
MVGARPDRASVDGRVHPEQVRAGGPRRAVGLALRGLVVNLGSRPTSAKVIAAAQSHPDTLDMPDEQADIYARRMAVPSRSYRCEGDCWMLTNEGLEVIKAPTSTRRR